MITLDKLPVHCCIESRPFLTSHCVSSMLTSLLFLIKELLVASALLEIKSHVDRESSTLVEKSCLNQVGH